jgi:hypothetical protein
MSRRNRDPMIFCFTFEKRSLTTSTELEVWTLTHKLGLIDIPDGVEN